MTGQLQQPLQRIPTMQVPVLVLHCYHAVAVPNEDGFTHVLVDPTPEASGEVQRWRGLGWDDTYEADGGTRGVCHLEIHDRHGCRRFLCARPGFSANFAKDSITFQSRTDSASVLPNPGVEESMAQMEADIAAGKYDHLMHPDAGAH